MTRSSGTRWQPKASELAGWDLAAKLALQAQGGSGAPGLPAPQLVTAAKVRNNSGEALPRSACVVLGDPTILPTVSEAQFRFDLIMNCDIPAADDGDDATYGILLQELAPDGVGQALITGVTAVRITGDRLGTAVEPQTDDTVMQIGTGWPILWQEPDSDTERWAAIAVSLSDSPPAVAWGTVLSGTVVSDKLQVGGETGLAKVSITYATAARYIGQEVWVGDSLGQILANEAAADRIGRSVIIGRLGKVPPSSGTFVVTGGDTARWNLITANCPG